MSDQEINREMDEKAYRYGTCVFGKLNEYAKKIGEDILIIVAIVVVAFCVIWAIASVLISIWTPYALLTGAFPATDDPFIPLFVVFMGDVIAAIIVSNVIDGYKKDSKKETPLYRAMTRAIVFTGQIVLFFIRIKRKLTQTSKL